MIHDVSCTDAEHDGSSWAKAYRSINEAIEYFANVQAADGVERFEILVREGDCYPRYSFTNLDPKTATINVLKTERPLVIKGGYRVEDGSAARKPLEYRSVIDGNPEGKALEDGLYHCITVAKMPMWKSTVSMSWAVMPCRVRTSPEPVCWWAKGLR